MRRWVVTAAAIGLVCSSATLAKKPVPPDPEDPPVVAPRSYEIVRLDDANGIWECYAWDVNNAGEVVGQVDDPDSPEVRAAYWTVSTDGGSVQSQLSTLAGGHRAHGINDAGEIVGYAQGSNGRDVAVYWAHAGASPLLLSPLDGGSGSCAYAINNQGIVCGLSGDASGWQAVAWRINWTDDGASVFGPIALPTPYGSLSSVAAINNDDEDGFAQAVGHFCEPLHVGDPTAAVAWTVQSLADGTLAVVDTRIVEDGLARALGVNDDGAICGKAGWPARAIVWSESGSETLNLARQLLDASAQDINNGGTIVGCASTGMLDDRAVVWASAEAKMVELNKYVGRKSPFLSLVKASAVNDSGEIVGYGFTEVGGSGDAAFLAIPE
jgi:uncharacterized membrane protein